MQGPIIFQCNSDTVARSDPTFRVQGTGVLYKARTGRVFTTGNLDSACGHGDGQK